MVSFQLIHLLNTKDHLSRLACVKPLLLSIRTLKCKTFANKNSQFYYQASKVKRDCVFTFGAICEKGKDERPRVVGVERARPNIRDLQEPLGVGCCFYFHVCMCL